MPVAELKIDSLRYGGWTSVRASRSIETMAGSFDLSVTERWPGQPEATPIRPGQRCELFLDGQAVISGWVDVVSPDYDAERHAIRVTGRDATCDLVDCSAIHKSGQWSNVKLDRIARDLIAPFGVDLVVEADVGEAFSSFNVQEGESVFECLERAARARAVLLTSDAHGRLVIARPTAAPPAASLVEGVNIEGARADFSMKERFSEYTVKAQGRLGKNGSQAYAAPAATARAGR